MREIGTATLGIMVERTLRKKTNTTRITSAMEINIVIWMSRTEARIVVVAFKTTESFMVGGIEARNDGRRSRTRSTVSIILAPGWRYTMIRTAGLPLARPPVRISSTESVTVAISDRRTTPPFLKLTTRGR